MALHHMNFRNDRNAVCDLSLVDLLVFRIAHDSTRFFDLIRTIVQQSKACQRTERHDGMVAAAQE
jgi:hypothetical protein